MKRDSNRFWRSRLIATSLAGLLALGCAAAETGAAGTDDYGKFRRLKYNNSGTTYLKSGLFSWPMIMDYDGDGDLDVVIHTGAIPTWNGTWFFENTGKKGDLHPVFRRARRLENGGGDSAQVLADGRLAVTQEGRVAYDYRENGMKNARPFAGLPSNVHSNNVRGNVWRFADLDGDGKEDLVVGVGDWKQYGWHNAWDAAGEWKNGPLHGPIYFIRNETGADGVEKWGRPEVLRLANGKPIDVWGYAAPLFADWDGDGDLDLLTCDFVDNFTYFENIGTKTEPKFATGRPILDKFLKPIEADLCMVTATVADWDGDGHPDFITCEEDARICLYRNSGRVAMGLPVFDEPYRFRQERGEVHFGILATPSVIDWDGDGDQDIITGNSAGYVAFIENLSGPNVVNPQWAEPKLLEADGAPIRIIAGPNGSIQGPCEEKWGYTCLSTGDWDGDGLPDVMLNSIRGEIHWCRNVGTRTAPKLAPPEPVAAEWEGAQPELAWGWRKPFGSKNILTQWRTTPYMIDLDEDGLMDLVMLDVEGYLCLWRRAKKDGKLVVLPPERCLVDEMGRPLLLAGRDTKAGPKSNFAGGSGRRKFCFADWTGDGKKDLIANSRNVMLYEFLKKENGKWYFAKRGDLDKVVLAGHTTNPTPCDFDGDGREDLLVGAEDGFFYLLPHACGADGVGERTDKETGKMDEKAFVWGKVADCDRYRGLHPLFGKAFEFLKRTDLATLPVGRYEIEKGNCWAMVQECELTPFGEIQHPEVHGAFIDIQAPLDGPETYGLFGTEGKLFQPFDAARDVAFADVKTKPLTLQPGEFVVFFPVTGAHAPCKTLGSREKRRKLVIKIRK